MKLNISFYKNYIIRWVAGKKEATIVYVSNNGLLSHHYFAVYKNAPFVLEVFLDCNSTEVLTFRKRHQYRQFINFRAF